MFDPVASELQQEIHERVVELDIQHDEHRVIAEVIEKHDVEQ